MINLPLYTSSFSSFVIRIAATMSSLSCNTTIATGFSSTITLNDGVVMPMFGLGTYNLSSGDGAQTETLASFALQNGYRLLDTAAFYRSGPRFLFLEV